MVTRQTSQAGNCETASTSLRSKIVILTLALWLGSAVGQCGNWRGIVEGAIRHPNPSRNRRSPVFVFNAQKAISSNRRKHNEQA